MARKAVQTVTLPILIDSANEKAEGFFSNGKSLAGVRVVKPQEVERDYQEIFGTEAALFTALAALKHAYEGRYEAGRNEAVAGLRLWFAKMPQLESVDNPTQPCAAARLNYLSLMTRYLADARLVMWFSKRRKADRRLSPAIHCSSLKTASFIAIYLEVIRICPYCKSVFIPDSDKTLYCSTKHGGAHRTRRSRDKKRRIELKNSG